MLSASPAAAQMVFPTTGVRSVPNEVLVGVTPELAGLSKMNIEATVGRVLEYSPALGVFRVRLYSGLNTTRAATYTSRVMGVNFVEPNYVLSAYDGDDDDPGYGASSNAVPNDSSFLTQQWAPQKVQADAAWSLWRPNGSSVVAIVDTGVALNHPDLVNKLYRNASGQVIGYDFINNDADPTDDQGHGTHCAGIAAAQVNNGIGISGIAGWDANPLASNSTATRIMPVKVLSASGSGSLAAVASGIVFAADNGADVISLSLGASSSSATLDNAVAYAWSRGCVVVAAAGNSGSSTKSYPGACANVISVAATDTTDTLASFSNYGTWVSCAAPGVGIYSTYLNNSYASLSGTSMATPLVAGEVALLASHAPNLSNVQLRDMVLNNVDAYKPYGTRTIKGKRVNVYKAIFAINSLPAAPSNLVATTKSRSQIALTWRDNSTNEVNCVLERSLDGVTYTVAATLAAGKVSYTNTGLVANKLYYYRVRTKNAYGFSAYSNVARSQTLP